MNELEFFFEESPFETLIGGKTEGDTVSAAHFLTLMEGADELELEDAFLALEERGIGLSLTELPVESASGEAAVRLRMEQQLARNGLDIQTLEQSDPLRMYLQELAATPAFGDENLLAQEAASGSEAARERLTNLGLSRVVELAAQHTGRGVLLLDLIQEGSLGLWQAVCSYRDGDYAAYRDRLIRFCLAKAVTLQARASGIGQKMRTALEDYRSVDERLLGDLGRNPTLEEMARELHLTAEETGAVKKMLDDAWILAQVKKAPEPEEEEEQAQQGVVDTPQFQMRQRILDMLSGLSKVDADILTLRFGLEGGLPLSPEETGRKLGLTPQEVTVREAGALAQLRKG